MSVFYSKTMYPISLGLIADDEYWYFLILKKLYLSHQ
jgi:hypothetical protein